MKAVQVSELNGPDSAVVADVDEPSVEGAMTVEMKAAGIAFPDLLMTRGLYQYKPDPPFVLGSEGAGTVSSAPEGSGFSEGDRVAFMTLGSCFAERVAVMPQMAFKLIDELSFEQGAAYILNYHTAHFGLHKRGQLKEGEWVLVHGAAGGVGMAAVQLGTMAGARVSATVRDEHCREQIATLGVRALTPDEFVEAGPFDVILELVGAPNFPANFEAIALCGRIGIVGIGGGAQTELNLGNLMHKRVRMFGTVMRARSLEEKALMTRGVEKSVLPGFVSGDLSVFVAETFPLDRVAEAYERFQAGGKLGKIVLEM
jgi:NADPH:quinone reductase